MSHVRVASHHNATSTQPRSERNLNVLAAPYVQSWIHLPLLPPEFGDCEHSHGDGSVVVCTGATAPELTEILVNGGGARLEKKRKERVPANS